MKAVILVISCNIYIYIYIYSNSFYFIDFISNIHLYLNKLLSFKLLYNRIFLYINILILYIF